MSRENLAINIILTAADEASKDIEAVNSKVKQLAYELDRSEFTRTAEGMERFGVAVKNATQPMADAAKQGLAFAAAMTAVAAALAGQVYQSAVSYESALLDLGKVLEGGRAEAEQYGQQLNALAEQYAQNGQELAGAMANMVQAGYDAKEAFTLVEESTKMMIAGDMEASESAANLISILKGFNAPASEAAHAVDLLNEVSNKYATDVRQLATGMAALSPVAKQMGFTMDEAAGLLTPIIEVYRSGAEAADALKVGLLKLTDDSDPVIEALEKLGVAQLDLNGNLRAGEEIFFDVARAFQNLSDVEKLDLTARLVGLEQAGRMSTALGNLGKVLAVTETYSKGTGSAIKEVETRLQSAQAQIDRTREQFSQFAATMGGQFKTEITGVVAATGALASAFDGAVQNGALEPLLKAIRPQIEAIETLLTGMSKSIGEALSLLDWQPIADALTEVSGEIGEAFKALTAGFDLTTVEGLRNLFQSLISIFTSFVRNIGGVIDGIQPLMSAFNAMFNLMTIGDGTIARLTGQMEGLSLSANVAVPAITGFVSVVFGAIGSVVELVIKITILIAVLRFLSGIGALSFLASLAAWFVTLRLRVINLIMILAGFSGAIGTVALVVAGLTVGLGYLLAKLADVGTQALYAATGLDLFGTAAEKVNAQRTAENVAKLNARLKEISDTTGVTVKNMIELDEALLRGELVYDALTNTYSKGNMELRRQQAEAKAAAAAHEFLKQRTAEEQAQIQALTDAYRAQGFEYDASTGAVKRMAAASQTIVGALNQETTAAKNSLAAQRQMAAERAQTAQKSEALVTAEQRLAQATEQYQSAVMQSLRDQSFGESLTQTTSRAKQSAAALGDMSDTLLTLKTDVVTAQAEVDRLNAAEGRYNTTAAQSVAVLEWRNGALREVTGTTLNAASAQSRLSDAIQKAAAEDARAYDSKLNELRSKQREVINLADAEAVRRRVLAQELRQSLAGIEEDIAAQKKRGLAQIQRDYEAHIGRLNAAARSHLDEVTRIEDEIAALKLSTEDRLRSLAQQGMTDQQRYQDQQKQIVEKGAAAREAALKGEFETAAKLYEEQAALAERAARRVMDGDKEIISEKKAVQTAYNQVAEAMKGQETALQSAADSHKARADAANQALEQTKAAAESVAEQLASLDQGDTASTHTVESNVPDVMSDIDSLDGRDTSSTHTVYVREVQTNAAGGYIEPSRFAAGGAVRGFPVPRWSTVPGVGNTDSVPASLAPGSYVLKKAATRYYGRSLLDLISRFADGGRVPSLLMPGERLFQPPTVSRLGAGFFDALNSMRLPRDELLNALGNLTAPVARFAAGGVVASAPQPSFAAPPTGSGREIVDINFQIEGRSIQLSGARDQAKALAGALRELQRRV